VEGEKMSKSLGNFLTAEDLVSTYGLDPVRFFLLREVPFGNDGTISRKSIVTRLNTELANDLGNLAQRTLSLIARNCAGRLPARSAATEDDTGMLAAAEALPALIRTAMDRQALHEALEETWKVIRAANAFIDRQAPWALAKTDPERMASVLRVLADVLRTVATVLQPFMPGSMAKMLDQLGVPDESRKISSLKSPLPVGAQLPPPQGVFPRYVEEGA
jgi:methionyl-tRNA synthetase